MQIIAELPATDRNGRHCFIQPGLTDAWGLHFFEQPDAQTFPYLDDMQRFVFIPGALQHIAFALPDKAAALALNKRLAQHNVATTPISMIGAIQNILFRDNNGLLLEATWPADER
jgi:hypothetical protein